MATPAPRAPVSPSTGKVRALCDRGCPVRDGIELSTDLYLPAEGGPSPSLVLRTPYDNLVEDASHILLPVVH